MKNLGGNRNAKTCLVVAAMVLLIVGARSAWSDTDADDRFARHASDAVGPLLAGGELSLFASGKRGKEQAKVGAEALVATALATELLKSTVRERRPGHGPRTSFPSGHASAAFAMATVIGDYHPKYKWPAYVIAGAVAWSRVEVEAHYTHDVLAGALLGHFIADRVVRNHLMLSRNGFGLGVRW